jgi:deazaflavin-dependent oxidoreductase (nitroreductase family)
MHIPVPLITFFDKSNQWLYALTRGRFGGQLGSYSMLLLHTVGRKTGQIRTHTLLYLKDGEHLVICASNNGQAHAPGWYWNLLDHPRARVQVGRMTYDVIAQEVEGEEYERLWQRFLRATSLYAGHRKRTGRHFPILLLKPVTAQEGMSSAPASAKGSPVGK